MKARGLLLAAASLACSFVTVAAPRSLHAQERGAAALGELVAGLGNTARVLMIGAHPDDEDTNLIAWLARGRHVETAYLSLTRGDGGQNLIGNELGEALGVIRTEELLAARAVDGGRQYFTRAFDFGFSKTVEDTYRHWPKDSILADVVTVVRAFRPHVIIAVFSGTPADGHGHHQVSGMLAREAFDLAADTVAFPRARFNAPWTPLKFYRAARFNPENGTLRMNVGEYSALLGRSYAEIAGESRSQHRSQGFGSLERKGVVWDHVRREASRVNEAAPASEEASLFDGIDTTWARFRHTVTDAAARRALESLPAAFAEARAAFDPFAPEQLVAPLARVRAALEAICPPARENACERIEAQPGGLRRTLLDSDLAWTLDHAMPRVERALRLASGISVDAESAQEVVAVGQPVRVIATLYNRGRDTVSVGRAMTVGGAELGASLARLVPPGESVTDSVTGRMRTVTQPWWLERPRRGGTFDLAASRMSEDSRRQPLAVQWPVDLGGRRVGAMVTFTEPVVHRFAHPVRGEVRRAVAAAPAVTVLLEREVEYARASSPLDRVVRVTLRSVADSARVVDVTLALPPTLVADSATRRVSLPALGSATVRFRVRGRLAAGEHVISATATSGGERFTAGFIPVEYDHIRPQHLWRDAVLRLTAVDVALPPGLRVAYVPGVGDNVAPMLEQLGIPVTLLDAAGITSADLSGYTTVVIGPRAYEANPALAAANPRLFDWARRGGTMVVQYGQHEMQRPGMMPYPVTLARRAERITEEDSPVAIAEERSPLLAAPNRIGAPDFDGWVQERATYMPSTWDQRYHTVLRMNDTGEPAKEGALLWTPVGQGRYVYAPLAFFRQLPAGNPGAARLFVNLLAPSRAAQP